MISGFRHSVPPRLLRDLCQMVARDPIARLLALALVSLDLLLTAIHGLKYVFKDEFIELFGYWIYRNLTITNDWSIPEVGNYLKLAMIVLLLVLAFARQRQLIYLAWAVVYTITLLDDSLQLHEQIGESLGALFVGSGEAVGAGALRAQDLGELLVYGVYGVFFVAVLGVGFLRSREPHRSIGVGFALLLVALACFVAGVDTLDRIVIAWSSSLARVLATVEDCGEMVVISLTLAFAWVVSRPVDPTVATKTPRTAQPVVRE